MNYSQRKEENIIIAEWRSLGDYMEDTLACYTGVHDKPNVQKLLLPNPKITEKLEKFRLNLDQTEFVKSTKLEQSIGEGTLDVGLYLAGAPECFIKTTKYHGNDIRIVFSPEVHLTSNPDALYLRGAAILSLIDSLESQGNRVELWMGWNNTISSSKVYNSHILVKRAQDYATASQLAGVACDSSFLRTCEYNMIAHFLDTGSVGRNEGLRTVPCDVLISGAYDEMNAFDSVESTIEWIEGIKRALVVGGKVKDLQGPAA